MRRNRGSAGWAEALHSGETKMHELGAPTALLRGNVKKSENEKGVKNWGANEKGMKRYGLDFLTCEKVWKV